MYEFQDLTPISGHFRKNFKISGISGQRPGLQIVHRQIKHTISGHKHKTQQVP